MSTGLFGHLRQFRETPEFGRKNRRGLPREALKVRSDSIEAREHTHFEPKIKSLVGPRHRRFRFEPRPSGRRLISGRPPGCQPILFQDPRPIPGRIRIFRPGPRFKVVKSELFSPSAARLPTSRNRCRFRNHFKDLRPVSGVFRGPVPSGGGYLVAGPRAVNRPFSGPPPIPGKLRIFWRALPFTLGKPGFPNPLE